MGQLLGVEEATGVFGYPAVWYLHGAWAVLLGVVFSLLVSPRPLKKDVALGVAWGLLNGVLGAWLALRTLVGAPLVLDAEFWVTLAGHLVYGAILGVVYSAFFRSEQSYAAGRSFKRVHPDR